MSPRSDARLTVNFLNKYLKIIAGNTPLQSKRLRMRPASCTRASTNGMTAHCLTVITCDWAAVCQSAETSPSTGKIEAMYRQE